jgi:isocitrate dehydrogenase kinase/phosphatase
MVDSGSLPDRLAELVHERFDRYGLDFRRLTLGARRRFEEQDWRRARRDWVARLELYGNAVRATLDEVASLAGADFPARATWTEAKRRYAERIRHRHGSELAETFFNSVARRALGVVGADAEVEFVDLRPTACPVGPAAPITRTFSGAASLEALVGSVLESCPFAAAFEDRRRDAALVAKLLQDELPGVDRLDMVAPVFYRNKGAYLVGRARRRHRARPLVIALLHSPRGIVVDAVLTTEDEVSVVFSFTRSYFFVDAECPGELVDFLHRIMPRKPVADLYTSIGYNRHGKRELYRSLRRHLDESTERFDFARGARGMVMIAFGLPSYDVVFKVVRDRFPEPKRCTRREVMEKYQLVFKHDRAGRLIDAQEFEQLTLDAGRFEPALLEELLATAGESVRLDGGRVVLDHAYTERRVTPLDVYLREAEPSAARAAIVDYGQAIRDLAATNIFPGDLLLKNFGVTRHGRVVFYDYDEVTFLTDCNFRALPAPPNEEDAMAAEPWFYVGDRDIFPEEFLPFLGLKDGLGDAFLAAHAPLLRPDFWRSMQEAQRAGRVVDIFPYAQARRLSA